jgi:hypothetical protein
MKLILRQEELKKLNILCGNNMKKNIIALSVILLVVLRIELFAQNITIGDHNVQMKVSFSKITDTVYIVNCIIENLTSDSILFNETKDFYIKYINNENPHLYINAGVFQKSYYGLSEIIGLKTVIKPHSKLIRPDTLYLRDKENRKVPVNVSFDYVKFNSIIDNRRASRDENLPEYYFIKISDYRELGRFVESTYFW